MSIDQLDKIDIISTSPKGDVVLHVADHFEWHSEKEHILLLQDKLNAYVEFIESGQLFEDYPTAKDNMIGVEIVFKYEPPKSSLAYIIQFQDILKTLNLALSWRIHNSNNTT